MSYKKQLLIGLLMELVVSEGEYVGRYKTRIEDMGDKILSLGAPFERGEVVSLREGTKVKLTYWDEAAAYSFEGKVLRRIAVPIPMFVVELPNYVTKVQRRSFIRVPALFPVTFQTVTKEGLSDFYQATMLDLSGGGMRFLTEERVESKALLYTHLTLPNGDLWTPVRVCRVNKTEDSKRYMVAVEFWELQERERDRIISCIFEIQRAMLKKGLA
ncbi:flagellar brake protein [Desulfosporosinus sp. OT]|uniref:flagellar brake protein n=1 Tax=Desulfosporosinus sp. OT TaxID=913865 RepID=UPI0002239B7A|nr:flagellar brake protein [Desulfosporosinus sp. OT]EGW38733.1 pilZ domain protein [Desulfosporosinus sp. OT]